MFSLFPNDVHPLPEFGSLLVTGPYHASAPIHLALSYARVSPESRPLLLSPSRTALKDTLADLNDGWLAANARCGRMVDAVSRIDMLYPPTPVHLSMLLSMLRRPSNGDDTLEPEMNPRTIRLALPGLVILHEPSLYFTRALDQYPVSSYTSMIAQTFAALNALSDVDTLPHLVVFDSRLRDLKVPMEVTPLPGAPENSQESEEEHMEELLTFAEPFFDTIAIVDDVELERDDVIPSSQGEDISMEEDSSTLTARQMYIYHPGDDEDESPIAVVYWREERVQDWSDKQSTIFHAIV
ncbi:hypothetical protein NMY22_g14765 [Coprinellus aureogranulatus]|nr:hypothetical protein NMY22_g14765 [Coprinellus aureogranulatus]